MSKDNIWDDQAGDNLSTVNVVPSMVDILPSVHQTMKDLAQTYQLVLDDAPVNLIYRASDLNNEAAIMWVKAGLLLNEANFQLSASGGQLKNAKPEFKALLEDCGLSKQRASELMTIARFVSGLSEDERNRCLGLGKKKLIELAKVEPELLTDLFNGDEDFTLEQASADFTRLRIKELEAKLAQKSVDTQKAENENEKLQRQLDAATKSRADTSDIVPPHVSDIRLETAALYKKAELSIDGIARLTPDIHLLDGEWALSSARSAFAALQGLIAQAKGVAAELHRAYGADLDGDNATMERLTQKELFKCATEYREIVGEHEHEAALRAYERDLDKPKGKGRPKAAPKLD